MKIESVIAAKGPAVFTVGPAELVRNAVEILAKNNIGAVIVVDNKRMPIGILSERDIVRELPRRAGLLDLPVSELMTTGMLTATLDDDVAAVLNTMTARHFRHLPVVEDGQLLGMVTLADLVRAQLDHLEGAVETLTIQLMDK